MKKRLSVLFIVTLVIFSLSSCKVVIEPDKMPVEAISTTEAGFDYVSAASKLSRTSMPA